MVIVVETLSQSKECHKHVLHRVNAKIIRLVSKHMGKAVHKPGGIEDSGVAEQHTDHVCIIEGLTKEIPGYHGWQHET